MISAGLQSAGIEPSIDTLIATGRQWTRLHKLFFLTLIRPRIIRNHPGEAPSARGYPRRQPWLVANSRQLHGSSDHLPPLVAIEMHCMRSSSMRI